MKKTNPCPGPGVALAPKLGRWSTLYTHTLLSGLQFKRAEEIAPSYFLLSGRVRTSGLSSYPFAFTYLLVGADLDEN